MLNEDIDQLPEMAKEIDRALSEMRVDYDNTVQIKNISESNNPLIMKRMKKLNKINEEKHAIEEFKTPISTPTVQTPNVTRKNSLENTNTTEIGDKNMKNTT